MAKVHRPLAPRLRRTLAAKRLSFAQPGHNVPWNSRGARSMPSAPVQPTGTQFDRIAATSAALVVVALAVFLLVRDEPIADARLFFVLRIVLSFSTSTLGATIPGLLNIRWSGRGLVLRAGGALALFVLTYVYTPDLVPEQAGSNSEVLRQERVTQDLVRQLIALSQAPAAPGAEKRVGEAIGDIAKPRRKETSGCKRRSICYAPARRPMQFRCCRPSPQTRPHASGGIARTPRLPTAIWVRSPTSLTRSRRARHMPKRLGWTRAISRVRFGMAGSRLYAGNLAEAETAYRRVFSLGTPGKDDWTLYWAHLGLGDVQVARGSLTAAIAEYERGGTIAERLAKADPGSRLAARPVGVAHQDRRRAAGAGRSGGGADQLSGLARDRRAAGRGGPGMPAGSATCRSRTRRSARCGWRRATWRRR